METFLNVRGLPGLSDLVKIISERFGNVNPHLKMIKEIDIKEPTSAFVVLVYSHYLSLFDVNIGVTAEQKQKFAYPDAYIDTLRLPLLNIFKVLSKIFLKHGFKDFSLIDLVTPNFQRTFAGFLILENYSCFFQTVIHGITPKTDAIVKDHTSFLEMCAKENKLIMDAKLKPINRKLRAEQIPELNNIIAAKESSISKLSPDLKDKIARYNLLVGQLLLQKDETNGMLQIVSQLEQELVAQMELAVSNPEQIEIKHELTKESLETINQQIGKVSESLDRTNKEIQAFQQMMESQSRFEKYFAMSRNLKTDLEKKEAMISNKVSSLGEHGNEINSMGDELRKKISIVNGLRENLGTEKAKVDNQLAAMVKNVQRLEIKKAGLDKKIGTSQKQSQKLHALIKEQKEKASHWIATKEQNEALIMNKKKELDNEVEKFMAESSNEVRAVHKAAEAFAAQSAKELADIEKCLAEQKAKDDAEGRKYKPGQKNRGDS